jgi:hypothetical protein
MAESKLNFPGFIGPSYVSRVGRFDRERTVNMYLETCGNITQTGKENQPLTLIGFPGLTLQWNLGSGPIRALYIASNKYSMYIVSGNSVYLINETSYGVFSTPTLVGTILTSSGFVSIADNGQQVLIVDGLLGGGYYTTIGSNVLTQVNSANFYPADTVAFQDGYFILNQSGTQSFFISDLYNTSFLPLNTANKSGYSDIVVGVVSNNRQLYLMGKYTIETWWDSGQSGSTPFVRQDGQFIQVGCMSPGSIQKLYNTFMWLGSSAEGQGVVYMMQNQQPVRVSNHAVEYAIQTTTGDLDISVAYTWQLEGHYFYALQLPGSNTTWVYDVTTNQWVEQQSNINGNMSRHLAQNHCSFDGIHMVGDYSSGNIYTYDFNNFTDNGNPIVRSRQSPHSSSSLNRIFYKLLEIDITPGTGITGGPAPKVTLEVSNDGGITFSNPIIATIGKIGEYYSRCRWQRLGSSRDRVFRVSCSDPIKFDLLSAYISAEEGTA